MTQDQIKHLEFIQGVIARMNSNSFQIKGWTITIVAALLALYASSESNTTYILIAILSTMLFGISDAYCLQQERRLRKIYNDVAEITPNAERLTTISFEMNTKKYKKGNCRSWRCFFSITIMGFYGLISTGLLIGYLMLSRYLVFDY